MKQLDEGRRNFFKTGILTVGAALLAPLLSRSRAVSALADAPKMADENDALPKAMGYKKDATKVDIKAYPKRAGADGKTQFCNNCQFYKEVDKKTGTCQILTNQVVASKGWCNSWTKKA